MYNEDFFAAGKNRANRRASLVSPFFPAPAFLPVAEPPPRAPSLNGRDYSELRRPPLWVTPARSSLRAEINEPAPPLRRPCGEIEGYRPAAAASLADSPRGARSRIQKRIPRESRRPVDGD